MLAGKVAFGEKVTDLAAAFQSFETWELYRVTNSSPPPHEKLDVWMTGDSGNVFEGDTTQAVPVLMIQFGFQAQVESLEYIELTRALQKAYGRRPSTPRRSVRQPL